MTTFQLRIGHEKTLSRCSSKWEKVTYQLITFHVYLRNIWDFTSIKSRGWGSVQWESNRRTMRLLRVGEQSQGKKCYITKVIYAEGQFCLLAICIQLAVTKIAIYFLACAQLFLKLCVSLGTICTPSASLLISASMIMTQNPDLTVSHLSLFQSSSTSPLSETHRCSHSLNPVIRWNYSTCKIFNCKFLSTHSYLLLYLFYSLSPIESTVCPQRDLQSLFSEFISYFLPLLISLNCGNAFIDFLNCTLTSIFNSPDLHPCLPYQCYFLTISLVLELSAPPQHLFLVQNLVSLFPGKNQHHHLWAIFTFLQFRRQVYTLFFSHCLILLEVFLLCILGPTPYQFQSPSFIFIIISIKLRKF